MLRLRLLGALTAEADGRPVAMPSSERARALIAWMALHRGLHPRSLAAGRLWPDALDSSARASLRTAVWEIRQAWGVEADVLVSSRAEIGLPVNAVWVDVLDGEIGTDDTELLPSVADEWADEARDRHRTHRRSALDALARRAEQDGRVTDAVRYTRQLCRLDPLDEALQRLLLERLLRAGDKAGAVLAARDFTQILRTELGVRPSPVTVALHARLHSNEPEVPRPRLFGRSAPLRQLTSAWRAAAGGAGQVVVLTGEAGIGKTSLLAELVHLAGLDGGRVSTGAGMDAVGETPLSVWLEIARTLVGSAARPSRDAHWPVELNRLSPQLGARLGHPGEPPPVAAPEIERLRVFEAVLRLVEWSCADRPAVIAVDDAHRADRASLRLTAHIGRRLRRLPLLLVLTRRDRPARPELDAVLADVAGRSVPVTEITLGPITDAEVASLATSLLPADAGLVRQVVTSAEGNPLLAVESARVLASGGTGPPPNLRTAVRATAGRLPAAAQTLLGLLATAGRPLTPDELDRFGLPELDVAEQSAAAEGLLIRRNGRFGFRHELLRDAYYADLPDPAPLHERVAAAVDPGDRAEVAHHLTLAGRNDRAAREWAAAAAYARSVGALAEAIEFLNRAVELTPQDGALWLQLQEVWAWLGQRAKAESAWVRAIELLGDADLASAWCRRGLQFRTVVCHPTASLDAYRAADAALTSESAIETRTDTLIGLAWGEAVAGDPAASAELLASAEALLPAAPSAQIRADIDEIRMHGLIRQGRFGEAVEVAGTASRPPDRAYAVWVNAACALACLGDYDGALALADRAVAATEPVPVLLVGCLAARAHILARLGRHEEAAETAKRQRACAGRLDSAVLAATAAHDAGLVALAAGNYPAAAELLAEALAGDATVSRPMAALRRAEALARLGDATAAAAQLRAAVLEPVGRADQPWALVPRVATVQALIAQASGDSVLARRRFEEAAADWRTAIPSATSATARDYTSTLLDLGRPPVIGLVEPGRELTAIEAALQALSGSLAEES